MKNKTIEFEYIKNSHDLVHARDAGNGYHGYCEHCGIALVTDLGYDSWSGTTCIDRVIKFKSVDDFPPDVRSYARFNGLHYNPDKQIFFKSYSNVEFTVLEVANTVKELISKFAYK